MSYTYNKIMSADGNEFIIQRVDEEGNTSYIPADPANSDYQAYLDRDKPKAALSTPIVLENN